MQNLWKIEALLLGKWVSTLETSNYTEGNQEMAGLQRKINRFHDTGIFGMRVSDQYGLWFQQIGGKYVDVRGNII